MDAQKVWSVFVSDVELLWKVNPPDFPILFVPEGVTPNAIVSPSHHFT
jgi:hypothetical protein